MASIQDMKNEVNPLEKQTKRYNLLAWFFSIASLIALFIGIRLDITGLMVAGLWLQIWGVASLLFANGLETRSRLN